MFEKIETARLTLRKPERGDAAAIFARYASDQEVTRFLAWPRHITIRATHTFLEFSDAEWSKWPVGPYLIESRQGKTLLGSTGLAFEAADRAATGYVLARDSWGQGYATEALSGVTEIARNAGIVRLYAHCHPDNLVSQRVLQKCGFHLERILTGHCKFPNFREDDLCDVLCYGIQLGG